jgi:transcriptional regulator with XRE-family HTH domain
MGLKQTVARNIRTLRVARGYTQEELSGLACINRNYTGMIEREERSPTVDTLEKIAKALDIDPVALLTAKTELTARTGKDQAAS